MSAKRKRMNKALNRSRPENVNDESTAPYASSNNVNRRRRVSLENHWEADARWETALGRVESDEWETVTAHGNEDEDEDSSSRARPVLPSASASRRAEDVGQTLPNKGRGDGATSVCLQRIVYTTGAVFLCMVSSSVVLHRLNENLEKQLRGYELDVVSARDTAASCQTRLDESGANHDRCSELLQNISIQLNESSSCQSQLEGWMNGGFKGVIAYLEGKAKERASQDEPGQISHKPVEA